MIRGRIGCEIHASMQSICSLLVPAFINNNWPFILDKNLFLRLLVQVVQQLECDICKHGRAKVNDDPRPE